MDTSTQTTTKTDAQKESNYIMGTEVTDAKNNIQSLQSQLTGKGGTARYSDNLTTESFVSIFNQVQKQQQSQKPHNENFGLYVRDQKLDIEIARELEKKTEKSQEQFQTRLEQQQEKLQAHAKDYKPEIFADTFIGTMISLMEALQNNRSEPLFSQREALRPSAENLSPLQNNPDLIHLQSDNQNKNNNHALRLIIDGIPSDQTNSSQKDNPFADLSEQDIALSYIFGNLQQNHQQLRKLSEGPLLQNQNPSQSHLAA